MRHRTAASIGKRGGSPRPWPCFSARMLPRPGCRARTVSLSRRMLQLATHRWWGGRHGARLSGSGPGPIGRAVRMSPSQLGQAATHKHVHQSDPSTLRLRPSLGACALCRHTSYSTYSGWVVVGAVAMNAVTHRNRAVRPIQRTQRSSDTLVFHVGAVRMQWHLAFFFFW